MPGASRLHTVGEARRCTQCDILHALTGYDSNNRSNICLPMLATHHKRRSGRVGAVGWSTIRRASQGEASQAEEKAVTIRFESIYQLQGSASVRQSPSPRPARRDTHASPLTHPPTRAGTCGGGAARRSISLAVNSRSSGTRAQSGMEHRRTTARHRAMCWCGRSPAATSLAFSSRPRGDGVSLAAPQMVLVEAYCAGGS